MSESAKLDVLENALVGLASLEGDLEKAERAAELNRLRSLQKIYSKRSSYINKIDKFWHIVLSEHPDFSEYIRSQDFKYLEQIQNIDVIWDVDGDDENASPDNFQIVFKFNQLDDDFPAQTITKSFKLEKPSESEKDKEDVDDDFEDDEILVSDFVDIIWPKSYDSINPSKVVNKKTPEGKKNYRAGMKSFFGWFRWTGRKPGKEFPSGDELARLFATDIYPNAVKYYTQAQRDGLVEEYDSEASEPLDLSDHESAADEDEHASKRQKTN